FSRTRALEGGSSRRTLEAYVHVPEQTFECQVILRPSRGTVRARPGWRGGGAPRGSPVSRALVARRRRQRVRRPQPSAASPLAATRRRLRGRSVPWGPSRASPHLSTT